MSNLKLPFSLADGLFFEQRPQGDPTGLVLPTIFEVKEEHLRVAKELSGNPDEFFKGDLDVSRLNRLHKHLWLAGLPQPPRPLHNQIEVGRAIQITEKADMHMLWTGSTIYLKPLPEYLLCHEIWKKHLRSDARLHAAALGLLQSYVRLIMRPSDHRIALQHGLLSENISWAKWQFFAARLVGEGILNAGVNPRYRFGELRLNRLQWIYRLCAHGGAMDGSRIRGYHYIYRDYSTFVQQHLTWLLTVFLYAAIALTAMQVGLAADHLKDNNSFQTASWGFAVFSMVAPLVVVLVVACYVAFLVVVNLVFTRQRKGKPGVNDPLWNDLNLASYKH